MNTESNDFIKPLNFAYCSLVTVETDKLFEELINQFELKSIFNHLGHAQNIETRENQTVKYAPVSHATPICSKAQIVSSILRYLQIQ